MSANDPFLKLVKTALKDLGDELRKPELADAAPELRLIGASSPIDSMALVSLIADLEGRIATEFGKEVILADERAMSAMRSPFRTVGALAGHIRESVEENPPQAAGN